jgi:hypothetical protein
MPGTWWYGLEFEQGASCPFVRDQDIDETGPSYGCDGGDFVQATGHAEHLRHGDELLGGNGDPSSWECCVDRAAVVADEDPVHLGPSSSVVQLGPIRIGKAFLDLGDGWVP